jgi:hypothetical protein
MVVPDLARGTYGVLSGLTRILLLRDLDLSIPAESHVAIVSSWGASESRPVGPLLDTSPRHQSLPQMGGVLVWASVSSGRVDVPRL